jgi:hypothetical protein
MARQFILSLIVSHGAKEEMKDFDEPDHFLIDENGWRQRENNSSSSYIAVYQSGSKITHILGLKAANPRLSEHFRVYHCVSASLEVTGKGNIIAQSIVS